MMELDRGLIVLNAAVGQSFEAPDSRDGASTLEMLSAGQRLQLATDAAEIGWWDVSEGYGQLTFSPRVKSIFGLPPDASVTLDDFFGGLHPEDRDRVAAAYAGAVDPARRALYDVDFRTIGQEDGVIRWISAKGRGVFDVSGRCERFIGTATNITERKRVEEERMAHQQEEAELREQFLAVLGHDLRTPLASIASATRVMVHRPEAAAETAEHVAQTVARMSDLIENLLDFARGRLGGGFITARDSAQPLEPVLLQVIEELKGVHPQRDIAVDIDLREPVICDRQRLGQLLSNLLGNAIDYGAPAFPVEVRAHAQGGRFELSVTNAGEPIEPGKAKRLFQPFFRGKANGNRGGLGLGLYICSNVAKAHGGTIDVASEGGKTCFTLRMPTGPSGPD